MNALCFIYSLAFRTFELRGPLIVGVARAPDTATGAEKPSLMPEIVRANQKEPFTPLTGGGQKTPTPWTLCHPDKGLWKWQSPTGIHTVTRG